MLARRKRGMVCNFCVSWSLINIKAVKRNSDNVSFRSPEETPESKRPATEPKAPRHLFGSDPGRLALKACENFGT